jgi:3-deoxy-D-manno-octulosonic acid (KDO) 8-phosphate synthase
MAASYSGWFGVTKTLSTPGGERHIMTGTAAQVAEDIDGLAALGVTGLVLNFQRATHHEPARAGRDSVNTEVE